GASAVAEIRGDDIAPDLHVRVYFTNVPNGTEVSVEVNGLPDYQPATDGEAPVAPHGCHIYAPGRCEVGDPAAPCQEAGGHWNPDNSHMGIMQVIFLFYFLMTDMRGCSFLRIDSDRKM